MTDHAYIRLQIIVFTLVSAAFANIYITQPVLPVLQIEFSADLVSVSFSVSAVILGIALSNLPFGFLADRLAIHRIVFLGGVGLAASGIVCALARDLWVLIAARFLQGMPFGGLLQPGAIEKELKRSLLIRRIAFYAGKD